MFATICNDTFLQLLLLGLVSLVAGICIYELVHFPEYDSLKD